jgi:hypothetical protein
VEDGGAGQLRDLGEIEGDQFQLVLHGEILDLARLRGTLTGGWKLDVLCMYMVLREEVWSVSSGVVPGSICMVSLPFLLLASPALVPPPPG